MKKPSYKITLLKKYFRKFCNLHSRLKQLIQNGDFFNMPVEFRNRMIRRLQLYYKRLTRMPDKQKLRWATAALTLILTASTLHAGFTDPVKLTGFRVNTDAAPAFVDLDDDDDLDIVVGDSTGVLNYFENRNDQYFQLTGTDNPFNGIDKGKYAKPAFADVDDDGDLDLLYGEYGGGVYYYRNNAGSFTEITGVGNPFDGIDPGGFASPFFADVDDDGDPDLLIGELMGVIYYWENDGGTFTEQTDADNPFNGIDVGTRAVPYMMDYDNDGDLDLFVGDKYGTLSYFENDGGTFTKLTGGDNPLSEVVPDTACAPVLMDVDIDNDLDLVLGDGSFDYLRYFENEEGSYNEKRGTLNPFEGIWVGSAAAPVLADLDDDGDNDMIISNIFGELFYYENVNGDFIPVQEVDNPFSGLVPGTYATPFIADEDGDGDLDLLAGISDGTIVYYINDGGSYVELTGTNNPFNDIDIGGYAAPFMIDYDGEGDLDLFIGNNAGTISYYKNVEGNYVEQTGANNPCDGIDVGTFSRPYFIDYDDDDDLDIFIGSDSSDDVKYYENDGGSFVERTGTDNPLSEVSANYPAIYFNDTDGDGDKDFYVGHYNGNIFYYEYLTPEVTTNPSSGLTTTEEGGTAIFNVVLSSEPTHNVIINVNSTTTTEGTADPNSITFTPANWSDQQSITITGVDDDTDDGDQVYHITLTASSDDSEYDGITINDVEVTNIDNDDPSSIPDPDALPEINVFSVDNRLIIEAGNTLVEKVEIYDISGTRVAYSEINSTGKTEMAIADIHKGIYIIKVFSTSGITTEKVVF